MPNFFIIAGCNGAGKTTASNTIFPEFLNCREFVNVDNIAFGLSPFNVESVAIEAGKIMLLRIQELLQNRVDFAIETTLTTRTYVNLIHQAKTLGYSVTLIYVWLKTPQMAIDRVAIRVNKGGHNIPSDVVIRRYYKGIKNLFELFIPICDNWIVFQNTDIDLKVIAKCKEDFGINIKNNEIWIKIQNLAYGSI